MTTLGIVLAVFFCLITIGLAILLGFYFKKLYKKINKSTESNFIVKKAPWYIVLAFLGAIISFFMLVAFSTFWNSVVSVGVYVLFGVLFLLFIAIMLLLMREKIIVQGENITVIKFVRKKYYHLENLSYKVSVNGDFGYFYFIGDDKIFSVNQYCLGYYQMIEYTKDVQEFDYINEKKPTTTSKK